jgi:hypothetical protein
MIKINSPDDGHIAAQNMQRIEINIYEKAMRQVGIFTRIILRWAVNNIYKICKV